MTGARPLFIRTAAATLAGERRRFADGAVTQLLHGAASIDYPPRRGAFDGARASTRAGSGSIE